MSEFEHSITINAPAAEAFRYLSNPENFPAYMPTVRHAEREGTDKVRMKGEHYESVGDLRIDEAARRMEWGIGGERDYRGWLQVTGDEVTSEVAVHIHINLRDGDDPERTHSGIVATLQSIQHVIEGKGRKIEHDVHGGNQPQLQDDMRLRTR